MPRQWEALPDKGPKIDEPESVKLHPKKKVKRIYGIEWRYIGKIPSWANQSRRLLNHYYNKKQWRVYKRYKKKADRDRALNSIQKREQRSQFGPMWEYRREAKKEEATS